MNARLAVAGEARILLREARERNERPTAFVMGEEEWTRHKAEQERPFEAPGGFASEIYSLKVYTMPGAAGLMIVDRECETKLSVSRMVNRR